MPIDLSPFHKRVILEDQECALRSNHCVMFDRCVNFALCPADHFSLISRTEIRLRQEIMKKMETR
jgi:hypothetical protein